MVGWIRRLLRRPVEQRSTTALRFHGEQDGPVERELKDEWIRILSSRPSVSRAYLAVASCDGETNPFVMLCLAPSSADDRNLVEALARPFRDKFAADEHLDMAFLDRAREMELEKVCRAFYVATRKS